MPTAPFEALTAERDVQVVEWDTSTLDSKLRDGFYAHYLEHKDSRRILVVPTDQCPFIRLRAVRVLLLPGAKPTDCLPCLSRLRLGRNVYPRNVNAMCLYEPRRRESLQ